MARPFGPEQKLVAVAVAFGFASVSYRFVERPLRDHPVLRARPLLAVVTGLSFTAAVVALALPALAPTLKTAAGVETCPAT